MSMTEECPFKHGGPKLRPELPELPDLMKRLKVDERGYPIPFFVAYVNGKPEFQIADPQKYKLCIVQNLCWVCGNRLVGQRKAFVVGPMCTVNRVSSEPPTHLECANWSVRGCPFLSRPNMTRRDNPVIEETHSSMPGVGILRNAGVVAIWETNSWKLFPDRKGGKLFKIGDPVTVTWWTEGHKATRDQVAHAFSSGMPILRGACAGPEDHKLLDWQFNEALKYFPPIT